MNIVRIKSNGFTLIELSIVLVIIGLLITGIGLLAQSQIESARIKSVITQMGDLTGAIGDFKARFNFLPGDLPVSITVPEIANVSSACKIGGVNAGNGNGQISANESRCVLEHLSGAGFVRPVTGGLSTDFGAIRVISNAASTVGTGTNPLPAATLNVIEFLALPCS